MSTTLPSAAVRSQATPSAPNFLDPIPSILTHGSLNIIAGASGVGKTCLLAWMITKLTAGEPIFGTAINPPSAIGYICADRGFTSARYWLGKAGMGYLPFYSLADDLLFAPARLRQRFKLVEILAECIDKLALPPGALVIVDPLALFMGGNLNDYQSCAVACIEIRRECMKRELTLIGTAHASKQKNDTKEQYKRLQDRILGSSAQLGYGDTQMYLASPEETGEKFYSFLWHPHTAPAEVFPLGRDESGMFIPWAESIQAAEEGKILAAIPADGSCIPLATILGLCSDISRATVFRKLSQLINDGLIERPVDGQYRRVKPN